MADGAFPFGAVGLVHLENRLDQHRPSAASRSAVRVCPTGLAAPLEGPDLLHARPRSRDRGRARLGERQHDAAPRQARPRRPDAEGREARSTGGGTWAPAPSGSLDGELGRSYAAVSGDRNPIHMHSLTAKLLGLPGGDRPRDVDQGPLPGGAREPPARRLRRRRSLPQADPAARPGRVRQQPEGEEIAFAVRDAKRRPPPRRPRHPVEPSQSQTGRKK